MIDLNHRAGLFRFEIARGNGRLLNAVIFYRSDAVLKEQPIFDFIQHFNFPLIVIGITLANRNRLFNPSIRFKSAEKEF